MGAFTIKNQPEKDTPIKKNVEIKDADKKNNGISDEEGYGRGQNEIWKSQGAGKRWKFHL